MAQPPPDGPVLKALQVCLGRRPTPPRPAHPVRAVHPMPVSRPRQQIGRVRPVCRGQRCPHPTGNLCPVRRPLLPAMFWKGRRLARRHWRALPRPPARRLRLQYPRPPGGLRFCRLAPVWPGRQTPAAGRLRPPWPIPPILSQAKRPGSKGTPRPPNRPHRRRINPRPGDMNPSGRRFRVQRPRCRRRRPVPPEFPRPALQRRSCPWIWTRRRPLWHGQLAQCQTRRPQSPGRPPAPRWPRPDLRPRGICRRPQRLSRQLPPRARTRRQARPPVHRPRRCLWRLTSPKRRKR